jgi:hypothetical protein
VVLNFGENIEKQIGKNIGKHGKIWQNIRKIIGKHGKQMGELDVPLCGLWGCIWMYQKRSKPILPDSWERASIFTPAVFIFTRVPGC